MGREPKDPHAATAAQTCIDCGAPVAKAFGDIVICDECLAKRSSCCSESGALDLTADDGSRGYASPACYAHLFEEDEHEVRHNPGEHCFVTSSGARLEYHLDADCAMDITHTFVPGELRGKGIAGELMKAAIQYATANQLSLRASCDYAGAYLKKHASRR